jgi:predicted TIM-barrel fold metal-dependent hydrolase
MCAGGVFQKQRQPGWTDPGIGLDRSFLRNRKIAMHLIRLLLLLCLQLLGGLLYCGAASYTKGDYARVDKIDIHVHLETESTEFVNLAKEDRFRFLNIAVHSLDDEEMRFRHKTTYIQHRANPDRVAIASSFPMAGWDEPTWQEDTATYLDSTFEMGAVAVKVWKDIGMEVRDKSGNFVMIDDPQFDPIFDHLAEHDIRLIGHLGEPKNCWLPLEEMTVKNDQAYFRSHPEYHMYLHPEFPSYMDQMNARDRMLEKHRHLPFMGAHLASLEWSVDELAKFLDRFPQAVVDTAARMGHLQYQSNQNYDRVRNFLIKYQDRILYGTDLSTDPDTEVEAFLKRARQTWKNDWVYLNTSEMISVPVLDEPVKGLALPKEVADKIYRLNAQRMFPQSWEKK